MSNTKEVHRKPRLHVSLSICYFTITTEIHACLLANFYCQYADRHMNLKFMRRVSEREPAIRQFVIVKNNWCQFFNLEYATMLRDSVVVVRTPPRAIPLAMITIIIIKITISSLVIGLKMSYFPLIRLPSCYRTVCYWIVCYWTVCYRTV